MLVCLLTAEVCVFFHSNFPSIKLEKMFLSMFSTAKTLPSLLFIFTFYFPLIFQDTAYIKFVPQRSWAKCEMTWSREPEVDTPYPKASWSHLSIFFWIAQSKLLVKRIRSHDYYRSDANCCQCYKISPRKPSSYKINLIDKITYSLSLVLIVIRWVNNYWRFYFFPTSFDRLYQGWKNPCEVCCKSKCILTTASASTLVNKQWPAVLYVVAHAH